MDYKLATICARKGSKGLPGKNTRLLGGIPLVERAIIQAKEAEVFSHIAISSDDEEVLRIGHANKVDYVLSRPNQYCGDYVSKPETIANLVLSAEKHLGIKFGTVTDLDVTAPLRNVEDIVGAMKLHHASKADSVITATRSRHNPYFNMIEINSDGKVRLSKPGDLNVISRQSAPDCYDMNAAVHVWRRDALVSEPKVFFENTILYEMPADRSIDIDSILDFRLVEAILEGRNQV
jgi:CMP-N,N'-diacetyllegionaminic acid synthase